MKPHRELIQGELERLFLNAGLSELCDKYLGIDAAALGLQDDLRSVFARRLLDWCEKENAIEALVDAVLIEKKVQADKRIKTVVETRYPEGELESGTKVGQFIVLEKAGEGGLGAIYRCLRKDGDEDDSHPGYGIRVIRAEHALDLEAANRFKTLMRSMQMKTAPAIERICEVGNLDDGRIYVVFEWTKGLPIKEFIPLSVLDALDMLESVMIALDDVHQQGFVHGDINADNVVVRAVPRDESGRQNVTLLGFGTDRLLYRPASNPAPSQMYGRFSGMAPEQAKGEEPTPRTDIYALGALLFELVTGKAPFEGSSPVDTVAAHIINPVPKLSDHSDDAAALALDRVVDKMMSKEPKRRLPTIDALRVMMTVARRQVEEIKARTAIPGTMADIQKAADQFLADPTSLERFDFARNEAKKHNAWAALIETIEEGAIISDDPVATRRLLLEAARIAVRNIRDYEKARELHSQLSEANPNDPEIMEASRELMLAEGRYEELISALVALAEASEDVESQAKWLREIGDVYFENLKDRSTAFDYYLACLSYHQLESDLVPVLDGLADRTGRFEELAAKFGELAATAEKEEDSEGAVFYLKKTGYYYSEKLDNPSFALSCYLKVLDFKPGDIPSLESVAGLYRSANQWTELTEVLMLLAEAEPTPLARREHLVEAGTVLNEHLDNRDGAVTLFEMVIADDPAEKKAVELLSKVYESNGEWQKLTDLLAGSLDALTSGPEIARASYRLGELYELHIDDLANALTSYENALTKNPLHTEALSGLERIFTRNGNADRLRANLLTQLELQNTPKKKVALKERLARLLEEEFKDFDGAITHLEDILEVDATNSQALVSLSRLYRLVENWEGLSKVLEDRARNAADDEKTAVLKERAIVIREKIGDAKLAAEAFQVVASLGADDALNTLALAQEEAGDFESAVVTVKKMADEAKDNDTKVQLMLRDAMLQIEKLGKPEDGVATLRAAQNIAPENGDVLRELRRGLVLQGNYTAALDVASEEIALADGNIARAELVAEVGVICVDHVGDNDRARDRFKQALDLDKNNLVASDRLSELYRLDGEWEKALRIYERWEDSSDALPDEKRVELFTRMAETFEHLDNPAKAVKSYIKANELSPDDDELALRLGKAALVAEDFQLAEEKYRKYMKKKGADLSDEDKVELLVGLGRAAFLAGNVPEAARSARQVTVIAPEHRDGLILLADVQETRRDYRGFTDSVERVLSKLDTDDPLYVKLLRRAGLVQHDKLRNQESALKKFKRALEIDPNNRMVLNDILKVYTATKQFDKVIETVLKTASLVDDATQLSRYYVAVAKIYYRELRQRDKAVEYYEMALEKDSTLEGAEQEVVDIMVESEDWEGIATHYRSAAGRLGEDAPVEKRVEVLQPLADTLVNQLSDEEEGIKVTETLAALEPANLDWKKRLGELYGWNKKHTKKAIRLHRELLAENPARVDSIRKLFNIFSVENEPDKAWCAVSLIALMGQGSEDEMSYFHNFLPEDVPPVASCLENDQWSRDLIHPDLNPAVSKIFSAISPVILSVEGRKLSDLGLKKRGRIDVLTDETPFAGFVKFVATTLGIAPPPLFYREDQGGAFELYGVETPILVASSDEGLLNDRKGIAFTLGQQLTLLRPGYFVHKILKSGTELSAWLLASIKSFVPKLPVQRDLAGAVAERLAPMKSLDKQSLDLLQGYVQSFVSQTQDVNTKKWGRAVEYTMDRTGLLLCGDTGTAVRILKTQIKDKDRYAERLRELTQFSVSEEHFKLRAYLGTALKPE